ncbi:hypothetical protein T4A_3198 [Trichinella pseudospiralis]|uniref:Uncharacterized protein n=1 Tax=Trichinella pseudospiralis TaxID=6337 RepID=A0A0V1EMN7_TRIPS|nr:hypothetical protein T4A_3198 [Trichinella pseudospiralis]
MLRSARNRSSRRTETKEKCGVGNRLNGKRPQAKLPAILQAICK